MFCLRRIESLSLSVVLGSFEPSRAAYLQKLRDCSQKLTELVVFANVHVWEG